MINYDDILRVVLKRDYYKYIDYQNLNPWINEYKDYWKVELFGDAFVLYFVLYAQVTYKVNNQEFSQWTRRL